VRRLLLGRALRGLADGLTSVILGSHLHELGFTTFEVGAIVTATLLGSALLTLGLAFVGHRVGLRSILLGACAVMIATGIGFAGLSTFWPLFVVAVLGTLNPSAGDVSVFLPAEQAALAQASSGTTRTALFAWHNLGGQLAAGCGALLVGLPALILIAPSVPGTAGHVAFTLYAITGVCITILYAGLPPMVPASAGTDSTTKPLAKSRRTVFHLAALFSLDSFGGGFAVQSLLVLWLHQRFGLSVTTSGQIFFAAGLLAAFSQLASPWLAARIGYVRTMVYTHLPANLFLILAGVTPSVELAVTFLLLRAALSQMDVPARQAYVMAVVDPGERAAAASFTNVPRSLASALAPLLAGLMLQHSAFGWPLVCGGVLKGLYDLLLLMSFRAREPGHDS